MARLILLLIDLEIRMLYARTPHTAMMSAVVLIAFTLIALGLVSGGLFALVPVLLGRDVAGAVALVRTLYDSLGVLMPAALWAAFYVRRDDEGYRGAYASMGRSIATGLQGATVGAILGAGPVFLVAATLVAAGVGGLDADTFGAALQDHVVWSGLIFVAAVTIGSAIPLGIWTYYTGPGRDD